MWERSAKIYEFRNACKMCRIAGQRHYKTAEPVCLETGGACAREKRLAPLPDLPLTRRATDALKLFYAASTQWRVGFGGATGLDYPACHMVADSIGVPWDSTFPLLRALEAARLEYVNDKEEAKREEAERKVRK